MTDAMKFRVIIFTEVLFIFVCYKHCVVLIELNWAMSTSLEALFVYIQQLAKEINSSVKQVNKISWLCSRKISEIYDVHETLVSVMIDRYNKMINERPDTLWQEIRINFHSVKQLNKTRDLVERLTLNQDLMEEKLVKFKRRLKDIKKWKKTKQN